MYLRGFPATGYSAFALERRSVHWRVFLSSPPAPPLFGDFCLILGKIKCIQVVWGVLFSPPLFYSQPLTLLHFYLWRNFCAPESGYLSVHLKNYRTELVNMLGLAQWRGLILIFNSPRSPTCVHILLASLYHYLRHFSFFAILLFLQFDILLPRKDLLSWKLCSLTCRLLIPLS